MEEREMRKEKARAAERWREIGTLLIELSRSPVSGPHVSKADVNTTTYIEILRLRRELVNATIAASDAFPDQAQLLTIFQRQVTEEPLDSSPEKLEFLRESLYATAKKLGNSIG